jgi:hypothetical protein
MPRRAAKKPSPATVRRQRAVRHAVMPTPEVETADLVPPFNEPPVEASVQLPPSLLVEGLEREEPAPSILSRVWNFLRTW